MTYIPQSTFMHILNEELIISFNAAIFLQFYKLWLNAEHIIVIISNMVMKIVQKYTQRKILT